MDNHAAEQKRFPDGGGGSRRFPRLFGVAGIVLGHWRRVRSFSDQLRAFFMHKSTVLPSPALPPSRASARYSKGKCTENPTRLPNHGIFTLTPPESYESPRVGTARLLLG